MLLKKTTQILIGILLAVVLASTANADTMTMDYSFVLSTEGDNPYELITNDIVTASVTYNQANGSGTADSDRSMHYHENDADFVFSLVLNNVTYTDADDDWASTWPTVTFLTPEWLIDAIDFETTDSTKESLVTIGTDTGTIVLTVVSTLEVNDPGYWSITGTPVPEPTTFALFGLGLFSLAGICRKRSLN